jgi:BRO1-like domain
VLPHCVCSLSLSLSLLFCYFSHSLCYFSLSHSHSLLLCVSRWYYLRVITDQHSVHFEKVCVLFNIGCVYNYIGTLQNRKTPDGIKVACHNFQYAAGAFEAVKEYLQKHPQDIAGVDLRMESLNMLTSLMLAQAQETYYEKASQDKRSPAVIAKLAAQSALFYQGAVALLEGDPLSSIRSLREWLTHCRVRESYYRAASHYRHAMSLAAELEYGQQVGVHRFHDNRERRLFLFGLCSLER